MKLSSYLDALVPKMLGLIEVLSVFVLERLSPLADGNDSCLSLVLFALTRWVLVPAAAESRAEAYAKLARQHKPNSSLANGKASSQHRQQYNGLLSGVFQMPPGKVAPVGARKCSAPLADCIRSAMKVLRPSSSAPLAADHGPCVADLMRSCVDSDAQSFRCSL